MEYTTIPNDEMIEATKVALEKNGFTVLIAENGEDAKRKALELMAPQSEVMTMTSVTLDTVGLAVAINESGKFNATRSKLMDKTVSVREKKRFGGGPEFTVGSVHALTADGQVVIASNTGSQLGAYAYGADHVIWVVGAQKITENLDAGLKRVYDYVLPLESERAKKAYGAAGSNVSKLLIVSKEVTPSRITIIIVKEALGF